MNILVTGGAGFIGSHFITCMLSKYDGTIVNLDALTYAGNLDNLQSAAEHPNYHFVKGDICDRSLVHELFTKYSISTVVHFAAESHVDRSIKDPAKFVHTNTIGTEVLLEAAFTHWRTDPENMHRIQFKNGVKFIQISTDEVYGTLGAQGYFTEETNLAPNSPYSASKASADMMARAYYETYGLPVIITRCSNNYGPSQNGEKFIPLIIEHALADKQIPVYGDGKQVRDWLHVEDHCRAIDTVLRKGKIGEVYNIGGNNEETNLAIVKRILGYLNRSENLIQFTKDRLGHDRRYAIDNTKIQEELGWAPLYTFEEGLKKTIEWYKRRHKMSVVQG